MTKLTTHAMRAARMPREIILEHIQVGNSVRVTAIDAETGTEVVFQAPLKASKAEIQKIAVQKLKYVMNKQKN